MTKLKECELPLTRSALFDQLEKKSPGRSNIRKRPLSQDLPSLPTISTSKVKWTEIEKEKIITAVRFSALASFCW